MDITADVVPEEVEIAHVPIVTVQPAAHQKHVRLVHPQHPFRPQSRCDAARVLFLNASRTAPLCMSRSLVWSSAVVHEMG